MTFKKQSSKKKKYFKYSPVLRIQSVRSTLVHKCSFSLLFWPNMFKILRNTAEDKMDKWINEPSEMKLRKSVIGSTNMYCNTLCTCQSLRPANMSLTCDRHITDSGKTKLKLQPAHRPTHVHHIGQKTTAKLKIQWLSKKSLGTYILRQHNRMP